MVQIESLSTPECQEGVPSPGGQQEVEHGGVKQTCSWRTLSKKGFKSLIDSQSSSW